jgi:DNA-binding MarR family transcriptional regulator
VDGDRLGIEPAERLAEQLFRLVRLVEREKERAAAAPGEHLERPVFGLLVQLVDHGPKRTTTLAEAVYCDVSTVSRQVNQLIQLGLIERQADPADGRASLLVATEKGRTRLERARCRRNQRVANLVDGWSAADLDQLAALLDRFNTAIETHRSQRSEQEPA